MLLCAYAAVKHVKKRRNRDKIVRTPKPIPGDDMKHMKFTHGGPLKIDSQIKCPVRHACNESVVLEDIQFDSKLNEVVDIGTNIELVSIDLTMTGGSGPLDDPTVSK
ncbi:unnamed protein product [Nippostrongylus brasiliensis]|uniref:Secreted protein n=1 Tax=Nippostrongylus brasiliensis TaxID=27835 RepID=A0A0N4Y520_NIPBR|nr:unnamed protein product [Nippostrongylus brasiliensis]